MKEKKRDWMEEVRFQTDILEVVRFEKTFFLPQIEKLTLSEKNDGDDDDDLSPSPPNL